MGQVVTIPPAQSCITGIFKKEFQGGRFNVSVAKNHVCFAFVAFIRTFGASQVIPNTEIPPKLHTLIMQYADWFPGGRSIRHLEWAEPRICEFFFCLIGFLVTFSLECLRKRYEYRKRTEALP